MAEQRDPVLVFGERRQRRGTLTTKIRIAPLAQDAGGVSFASTFSAEAGASFTAIGDPGFALVTP